MIGSSAKLSCVLLAAGLSSRMGETNKLLLSIQGEALIRRTTKLLLSYGMQEVVVVLGHQADKVATEIADLPVKTVVNQNYTNGQMTSVHAGLGTLSEDTDGVMICLSDLVLLTLKDIREIHSAYTESSTEILVPTFNGERGNPIIFSPQQRQAILSGERNLGCRKLISKNPELVTVFEAKTDHVTFDLDTPDAVADLTARLSNSETDMNNELERTA